jgi:hypothetical protein
MRNVIAATLTVVAGLVVANMLGVAGAEAPTTGTTAPVRTITVEGVATVPVTQGANRATATAAYREGMAAALADGQSKAEFLASKAAVTLSGVQSLAEGGGSINCTGGEESEYVAYQGEQPDFGSTSESVSPLEAAAPPRAPTVRKPPAKRRKKHPTAKPASAGGCTLSTQVSLVYAIT